MRAYNVLGKRYYPTSIKSGQVMHGISSWYGPNFHGKYTSNGEVYNMHARTAAHKTWPMDTMVKVTNLQNGKSTVVRINDRGPFVRGRIIDCSYTAGREIGLDKMGIAKVKIEAIGCSGQVYHSPAIVKKQSYQHIKTHVKLHNFGIQVGAFKYYVGAEKYRKKYTTLDPKYTALIKKYLGEDTQPVYRVWLMGFGSEEEARDFQSKHALLGAIIISN
jgi:rare lipoprotein A